MLETIQEVPEPVEIDIESLEREKRRVQRERVMKLKKSLEEANSTYLADITAIRTEAAEKLKKILITNRDKINKSNISSIYKIVRPLRSPGNKKLEMGETQILDGFSGDSESQKKMSWLTSQALDETAGHRSFNGRDNVD